VCTLHTESSDTDERTTTGEPLEEGSDIAFENERKKLLGHSTRQPNQNTFF
jgi:hypothetical protein